MRRILVAEAKPRSLLEITDILSARGYYISYGSTSTQLLEKARGGHFDGVLIDGKEGLGHQFIAGLRQAGLQLPIVILFEHHVEVDRVLSHRSSEDKDTVTSLSDIADQIDALLKRDQQRRFSVDDFRLGETVINFKTYEARRGGKTISLTALEFQLLRYLIERRNEVVTREEILEAVWGEDVFIDARTVDTHIAHLRKKLEGDPVHPKYLTSVRGVGYKLVA